MIKRILLLAAAVALSTASALAQSGTDRALITVHGAAEVMVVPDEVVFNLKVVTMDRDLLAAQTKNDQTVKTVLALGRKYEIPATMLQTGRISLSQRYSDEEVTKKPSVFLGYTVTKKVTIILRDVSKAEQLLGDIFKSGVSEIEDVDFRTTQARKYKDQARTMAIKAAQEKAAALSKEIGQSIGKAYSIIEEGVNDSRMALNTRNTVGFVSGSYSDDESTIALGQISITARLVVSFELK